MLIYLLQEYSGFPDFTPQENVIFAKDIQYSELPPSDSLSMELFGLPLTAREVKHYSLHYSVWKDFLARADDTCLIIERVEDFINNQDILLFTNHEIVDFEILLAFDPRKNKPEVLDVTYTFGHRMGVSAYYINNATAHALVQYQTVQLPVDEFFLYMSDKELLTINLLENALLDAVSDDSFFYDRNENKLKTILSTDHWTHDGKIRALQILRYLFMVAEQLDVPLFLSDGTLLGFVRHGEIMGWDDDIDISTDSTYIQQLISKIEQDSCYEISRRIWRDDTVYYKVWHKDGNTIEGYSYTFPFVDIWLYTHEDDAIDFGYREPLSSSTIYPLEDAVFEQIKVRVPNRPLVYLDGLYLDWRECIQIYDWNHQTEKSSNLPLRAVIHTDPTGMLIIKE